MLQTEIKMAIHTAIEHSINRFVQLDPHYQTKTASLHGQTFALEFTDIEQTLYFYFTDTDILLRSECEEPDVILSGKLFDFIKQAQQPDGSFAGKFRIQGDIESAQAFQKLLKDLNIDLEELLSLYTGDIIAHKVGAVARGLFSWGTQVHDTTLQNVADYLQNESEIIPEQDEITQFSHGVNTFRDDVARLQARITRLEQKINDK